MTMGRPTDDGAQDDELLGELRRVMTEIDPEPGDVTAFAKAALDWRRIDAELAELLADSALETGSLAHTRAAPDRSRTVTFSTGDLEIDLEIQQADSGLLVLGLLAPPIAASIAVQRDDGWVAPTTETDELGRFRIEIASPGRIRLRITPADAVGDATVETSWLAL
jgi:hypothetical protein